MECPICKENLNESNYCRKCNVSICPKCTLYAPYKKQLSIPKAILFTMLLPILLIGYILLPLELQTLFAYRLKKPNCVNCGSKYIVK